MLNWFRNRQCAYLVYDRGEDLHLFVPHRWQRVLHFHLQADDLRHLSTKADLGIARK